MKISMAVIKKCLRAHYGELSDTCKHEIAKSRGH